MPNSTANHPIRLITLDPGHFHAALVHKFMYPEVDPQVHVYAPPGPELDAHLKQVERFNGRPNDPTRWRQEVYSEPDYFQRMLEDRPGNVVVISGNNARKTEYILKSIQAGLHVLADKPMVIVPEDLPKLLRAFALAEQSGVLLYDIMTERFEITTILQRELSRRAELFGRLAPGTADEPAITKESVHHFAKIVSGAPLKRPAWFFDVSQQGEGIVDVTTHLVDLVQWEAFPEQALRPEDVTVLGARRWATAITPEQFLSVTGQSAQDVLHVYSNGEFTYRLRGIHARVSVVWNYQAPPGGGDTHFSVMRGTRARLTIKQGPEQGFKPVLYVEPTSGDDSTFEADLTKAVSSLQSRYPGIGVERDGEEWRISVPSDYEVGHEAHFSQVTANFLKFVQERRLPEWEVPNMITKYATIMKAYELSR